MTLVHWPTLTCPVPGQTAESRVGQRVFLDTGNKVKFSVAPLRGTPLRLAKPAFESRGRIPYEDFNVPDVTVLIKSTGVHMSKTRPREGGRSEVPWSILRLIDMLHTAQLVGDAEVAVLEPCEICDEIGGGDLGKCPICLLTCHYRCQEACLHSEPVPAALTGPDGEKGRPLPGWLLRESGHVPVVLEALESTCLACRRWLF